MYSRAAPGRLRSPVPEFAAAGLYEGRNPLSDSTDVTSGIPGTPDAAKSRRRSGGGLNGMLLNELQTMASSLGIAGTARMRKGDLIAAIEQNQAESRVPRARVGTAARADAGSRGGAASRAAAASRADATARGDVAARGDAPRTEVRADVRDGDGEAVTEVRAPRRAVRAGGPPEPRDERIARGRTATMDRPNTDDRISPDHGDTDRAERNGRPERGYDRGERNGSDRGDRNGGDRGDRNGTDRGDRGDRGGYGDRIGQNDRATQNGHNDSDEDVDTGRRGRRSRFRDRRRGRGERTGDTGGAEPQVSEDDVLVQVAGIVDVLDNYAFVRTSGYLAGPNDVYVSMSQIKKYGLRRGDAVTGAVRAPRDGEQRRDKYNPLVRLDTINGMDPEEARRRPEFYKLTPLYPQERLRLETEPHILTTRVIDLVMPIGKGQRALIVSPPKAGKTMIQQAIANAISHNNPECHLMVVLVDERPEEVTDMQRSVKGEVIASTFDRPPQDHTTVAELAIERAKRLVELGHDVVVLLDSITRLGRAYNLAAPASGRILSGGIDSTALYPPKRFLGAARNIENGGSLTIIANALVETGSMMDTVIFEEFKGTGNAELKLDRKIADKRVFPAIDIDPSGTRKEDILLAPDEYGIVIKLRKVLHSLDSQAALDLLLDKLKQTRTNIEFLMQIAKTTPGE
jgi:transcription termination factor Rho